MAKLKIEILLDKPRFFRLVRVGNWILTHNYETGEGEWNWEPEEDSHAQAPIAVVSDISGAVYAGP